MGFWSKKRDKIVQPTPYQSALEKFDGDFSEFCSEYWEPVKIWLPEPLEDILRELADHFEQSRSELIRQALFVYVYGRYRFEQMRAQRGGLFKGGDVPLFSLEDDPEQNKQRKNRAPQLGKNSVNMKVYIPARLKDDLDSLAKQVGITFSHLAREILISTFMGHKTLPQRGAAQNYPASGDTETDQSDL